jgi:tetratricopeptide (TPR) repeat protein
MPPVTQSGIVTALVTDTLDEAITFASAMDAVHAAIARQREASPDAPPRIGIHVGESPSGAEAGATSDVARQLSEAAEPGRILVSDLVHALVGSRGDFVFQDAGYFAVNGLADPLAAWEVTWREATSVTLPLPAALSANERLPFVGRETLFADLRSKWAAAAGGGQALVMLAGEPGIGKTRLASECARELHDAGAVVIFGHADEETLLPYQPFVEAFHHVIRSVDGVELRTLVGDNGAELARLLPGLHEYLPELPAPNQAEQESDRLRLFEAVTDFLTALSARGPVVLVLDDLHWADKPTLLLLHHLFGAPLDFGLLVIGTYRDTDLDRRHPLADTLADLRRLVQFERLAVGGLAEDDLLKFLSLLAGQEAPAELARSIHAQTEGNPFYISEVLRNFVESGAVGVVDGEWVAKVNVDQLGIPEGVKEVIGRRVTRLSDDANAALAVAAVVGRDFDLDVVARVTEFDDERLLDAIEEAVTARLIVELPDHVGRFHFAHALVRETLCDELTTARRVRMHRRIALAIEQLHGNDPEPPLAQLAFHYLEAAQSGDATKSVEYAREAGRRALDQFAYEEAAEYFERALQALDLSDTDDLVTRGALLVERGQARDASGDRGGARSDYEGAAAVARELGDEVLLARAALGWAGPFTTGTMDKAIVALLEEALAALPSDDSSARAQVMCRLSFELYWGGDRERMRELATTALDIARRLDDQRTLGAVLNVAALLYDGFAQGERRLELSQEAVRAAEAAHDGSTAHLARSFATWAQLELGDRAGWDRTVAEGSAKARELRLPRMLWYVPLWQATAALMAGEIAQAEQLAMETLQLGQAADDLGAMQIFGVQMFSIRREQGRLAEFDALVRNMIDDFPAVPAWQGALALLLAELHHDEEAIAYLDILCADGLARVPRDNAWAASITLVGEASYLVNSAEHAAPVYDVLREFGHRFVSVGQAECYGSVQRILGQAAAACGRSDDAVVHFEQGIDADLGMGGVRSALRGRAGLVGALLDRDGPGDAARAAQLITDGVPHAERLGLVSIAERLRERGMGVSSME